MSIVDIAREKALEQGKGLNQEELLQVLQVPDSQLEEIADIAHQTRLKWCGPDVSVEGIISIKTGGWPQGGGPGGAERALLQWLDLLAFRARRAVAAAGRAAQGNPRGVICSRNVPRGT